MTKAKFWTLNVVSLILVSLLLAHFFLSRSNNSLGTDLSRQQNYLSNSRQVTPVLDQLAKRIAEGSDTDPRLRNILTKFGLSVTLDMPDGKKKTYP